MKHLIAILNNISDWLVLKLSKKIIFELTWELRKIGFWGEVNYRWNTSLDLDIDLIAEHEMIFNNELKIYEVVGNINNKYPMISIRTVLFKSEDLKDE
jgi:hypothetical protein